MSKSVTFFVFADPVAQPRVKAVNRGGFTRVYTPSTANKYKEVIRWHAVGHWMRPPSQLPIALELQFLFARPKSMVWKKRAMPRTLHTTKPDVDNLCKAVMDALSGIIFEDDRQVAKLVVSKGYCAGHEEPHTVIKISEVGHAELP